MPKKIELTKDQINIIVNLFNDGFGTRKIAEIIGVKRNTVQRFYKKFDLNINSKQSPRHVYKLTEKLCATCKTIKSIIQFRKRIGQYADGTERISYESSCLDCEKVYSNEKQKRRAKKLRKTDPNFVIRKSISYFIWKSLKDNNSSKNGKSCLDYLNYTIEELKKHLENQFESWMTWNNHGVYKKDLWNDNDSGTWTWQIDHIIPQTDLPYTSMDDENFKKCWSLENLRPLSSKNNNLDGVNRTRHKKAA
jgi:hypothetical protein